MKINEEGIITKLTNDPYIDAECPFCNCRFSFNEADIEEISEKVPYESGLKGFFGQTKYYITHRYVTCPWCKSKMKLKLVVDTVGCRKELPE